MIVFGMYDRVCSDFFSTKGQRLDLESHVLNEPYLAMFTAFPAGCCRTTTYIDLQ